MHYQKYMSEPWFTYFGSGLKTVEGRLLSGSLGQVKAGDMITFYNGDQVATAVVTEVRMYDSFRSMLEEESLERTLPGILTMTAGVAAYRKFYSPEDELDGVIAISFD